MADRDVQNFYRAVNGEFKVKESDLTNQSYFSFHTGTVITLSAPLAVPEKPCGSENNSLKKKLQSEEKDPDPIIEMFKTQMRGLERASAKGDGGRQRLGQGQAGANTPKFAG